MIVKVEGGSDGKKKNKYINLRAKGSNEMKNELYNKNNIYTKEKNTKQNNTK